MFDPEVIGENVFYSYAVSEDNEGFYVVCYDKQRNAHDVAFTHSRKIADYLCKHFDDLAMDEEKELFGYD